MAENHSGADAGVCLPAGLVNVWVGRKRTGKSDTVRLALIRKSVQNRVDICAIRKRAAIIALHLSSNLLGTSIFSSATRYRSILFGASHKVQEQLERKRDNVAPTEDLMLERRPPRIDIWRLGKRMLLALILPILIAIGVDVFAGTWPFVTLLTAAFCFPIAGFLVMRAAVQEMHKVISEIAPEEQDEDGNETAAGHDESALAGGV